MGYIEFALRLILVFAGLIVGTALAPWAARRPGRRRILFLVVALTTVLGICAAVANADCPIAGEGGDPALNELKNRVDKPGRPTPMGVPQILELKGDGPRAPRAKWTADQRRSIASLEGAGVVVVGYMVGAKEEGPEAANCHGEERDQHDFHLWLANQPGDPKGKAVVIEITPRQHDRRWTLAALHRIVRERTLVRVTGWLMFDQEHGPDVGRSRGTLWEIHPITEIEEMRGGGWYPVGGGPKP